MLHPGLANRLLEMVNHIVQTGSWGFAFPDIDRQFHQNFLEQCWVWQLALKFPVGVNVFDTCQIFGSIHTKSAAVPDFIQRIPVLLKKDFINAVVPYYNG